MQSLNKILVFTNGDANNIATWSNVPYFFTTTLEQMGYEVIRINIGPIQKWENRFNRRVVPLLKRLFPQSTYDYFRSAMHHYNVRTQIKAALVKHNDADLLIFLTFSFSSFKLSKKPYVLFGDWTYRHYLEHHKERKPDWLERQSIRREDRHIEGALAVFPLFPVVANKMNAFYRNKHIFYLGNVINAMHPPEDAEACIREKAAHKKLLFVGSRKYLEGCQQLMEAFKILRGKYPDIELHIVGIRAIFLPPLQEGIFVHGYLDKGNTTQRETYYQLLKTASLFVNTTPKWAAFSATLEAMYYYTPVLVSETDEMVETFGKTPGFGKYTASDSGQQLAIDIEDLLKNRHYPSMCQNAYHVVESFTWHNYLHKLLKRVDLISA